MKATAHLRGLRIDGFVADAMRRALDEPARNRCEVELPMIRSDESGSLKITNAKIEELLS